MRHRAAASRCERWLSHLSVLALLPWPGCLLLLLLLLLTQRAQWDFPLTSAEDLTDKLIKIGEAWGPDLLYRLEGHTPNYTAWAYDISDDSPKSVQVTNSPLLSIHLRNFCRPASKARVGNYNGSPTIAVDKLPSSRSPSFPPSPVCTHATGVGCRRLRAERGPGRPAGH